MKKLALAALAAMPALAGTPADVPAVTLTPAPAASPWSADLAAVYRYQLNDPTKLEDSGIHTMGADLTLNYAVTEADYVNIRFGYSYGNETWRNAMGSLESNRHTFYIMPGYKHEWTVSEKTKVYAGANIGMANLSDKTKMKMDRVYKDHDSDWGFAYSAEVGGSYDICPDWSVFAAIEIFGTKVTPISSFAEEPVYTGVRFGVSHHF